MGGNGKVFVSHSHEDHARCAQLLRALDEWGIDYWFDTQQIYAGDHFIQLIEQEIQARDIFIRVCSRAARHSYWVGVETGAFQCLLADDYARGLHARRRLIHVIVDPKYDIEPFVRASLYIDAANNPEMVWQDQLHRALTARDPAPPANATLPFAQTSQGNVRVFVDDDEGYRFWVESHPTGFVLNSFRTPRPNYVMLHRTKCGWIQRPIMRGDRLTDTYIKICSRDRSALEDWSRRQAGTTAQPCGLCKP